jgi:hypothetical protein
MSGVKVMKRMIPHPHAYDWHDGHTSHHAPGLTKDEPFKHPHTDGAIPPPPEAQPKPQNDQAAGKGVATYQEYAKPFGDVHPGQPSNLFHYDYSGKHDQVNKLVADHGFQVYYAGGKYGKPDLANRNYNTRHLMVYDPTPSSGGDFNDFQYTDSWRKTHELSHALTYPELNNIYGEGRRIGKLGYHRSVREALRAVHWEWLAAHKQRELNQHLGIHVPDDVFHRELNTVMHDAAHRAVTGQFTEPSQEGFVPSSNKVPLQTSLGLIHNAARKLGLTGPDQLLARKVITPARTVMTKYEIGHTLLKALRGLLKDEPETLEASEAKKSELVAAAKKKTCRCSSYTFPHRHKGGKCKGE